MPRQPDRLRCLVCCRTLDEAGSLYRIPWRHHPDVYFLCGDHLSVAEHPTALVDAAKGRLAG